MDNIRNKGLNKLPRDRRDWSHHRTFGGAVSLPNEYIVKNLDVDDQGSSQLCTAYSSSECAESQWNTIFSPEFTAAKIGELNNKSIAFSGADLRQAMKAGCKFGFLPKDKAPFTLQNNGELFCGDWNNWPVGLDLLSIPYKMDGFYAVDGPYDIFDQIRNAMWIAHQDPNDCDRTVEVGTKWYAEWEQTTSGIIPKDYSHLTSYHAHRILGWKVINGETYLVDQQAQGKYFGDNGLVYFPREVVNREFTEGLFIFRKNPDPNQIKTVSLMLTIISKMIQVYQQIIGLLQTK